MHDAGHDIDAGVHRTLDGARDIAGKLVFESGKLGEDVGSAIDGCGKKIESLGKRISKKG